MKFFRRATTLIGVVALTASTLLASDAMAQQISTTITVENSTPACVDEIPTALSINFGQSTSPGSFFTLTPNTSSGNHNAKEIGGSLFMNLYVNQCLGQGWEVTAAMTDFHSGLNTVDAAGKLQVYAQSGSTFMGIVTDYTRPVRLKEGPPSINHWSNPTYVPGTTGLPVGFTSARTFADGGDNRAVASGTISTGTVDSSGEMIQAMKLRSLNVPNTTAPGTYSADFTLTFTSTGP